MTLPKTQISKKGSRIMIESIEPTGCGQVRIHGSHGGTRTGELVAWSANGFVLLEGRTYTVYDGDNNKVASVAADDWLRRSSEFSQYC